jgi:hypothetical protein
VRLITGRALFIPEGIPMKKGSFVMILLLTLFFTTPVLSHADSPTRVKIKDRNFYADFHSRSGCLQTVVHVAVFHQFWKASDGSTADCDPVLILSGSKSCNNFMVNSTLKATIRQDSRIVLL